jgi:putative redox protein
MRLPVTTETALDDSATWVRATVAAQSLRADIEARGHSIIADEPVSFGGTDAGPTPYEILLAALSSCTAMTLRFYAKRKSWPLESVSVSLRSGRIHEKDCEHCATEPVGISHIQRKVEMTGPLTDEQRDRLLQIADRCPIKQTLEHGIHVESVS